MVSGSTDEPQVVSRHADPSLRDSRGAVRDLVLQPVRPPGRSAEPGRGYCRFRRVAGPGRLRQVVPAQDEDAPMRVAMIRDSRRVLTSAAALVVGGSTSVFACPVCFGAAESSMIDGAKLGVLVLLAITMAVQGAFVGFFLYLRKRAKRIAELDLDTEWSKLQDAPRTS